MCIPNDRANVDVKAIFFSLHLQSTPPLAQYMWGSFWSIVLRRAVQTDSAATAIAGIPLAPATRQGPFRAIQSRQPAPPLRRRPVSASSDKRILGEFKRGFAIIQCTRHRVGLLLFDSRPRRLRQERAAFFPAMFHPKYLYI